MSRVFTFKDQAFLQGGSLQDDDADLFISANSITDATVKKAITELVIDYKNAGIWAKTVAIFPFAGDTDYANQYRMNLKDRTSMTFFHPENAVFNSAGIYVPSGVGYLYSGPATTSFSNANIRFSTYAYGGSNQNGSMGFDTFASANTTFGLSANDGAGNTVVFAGLNGAAVITSNQGLSTTSKFVVAQKTNSSTAYLCINGTSVTSASTPTNGFQLANLNVLYCMPASAYARQGAAFFDCGESLSSTELTDQYNAVIKYLTTMGRI